MDWRYNTIWFDQIDKNNLFHSNFKDKLISDLNFEDIEYAMTFYYKYKELAFDALPKSSKLLYLEMNLANFKDLSGIDRFEKLKRLELHYCTKLVTDFNISALKDTLEFLHINQSKKYTPTAELFQLKNLKVLCLNACGSVDNLKFLNFFPKLIDFRFVDTNVLDGDLTPILEHPTIRTVGFLNKRHYNYSEKQMKSELELKSTEKYKEYVYKDEYKTYRYNYEN
jgi:hypothetical protein